MQLQRRRNSLLSRWRISRRTWRMWVSFPWNNCSLRIFENICYLASDGLFFVAAVFQRWSMKGDTWAVVGLVLQTCGYIWNHFPFFLRCLLRVEPNFEFLRFAFECFIGDEIMSRFKFFIGDVWDFEVCFEIRERQKCKSIILCFTTHEENGIKRHKSWNLMFLPLVIRIWGKLIKMDWKLIVCQLHFEYKSQCIEKAKYSTWEWFYF